MSDVIEVSYTGDLLAHRRCRRAWAYEKRAGFHPYEVVQAMEGRLVHHAMEWLTRQHQETFARRRHATEAELRAQLDHYYRVLWARGIRTAFANKADTIDRVVGNLYPNGRIDPVVRVVIEGAQHTEYELRAVKKVLPAKFSGKSRILLTGILDLVIQQQHPLTYQHTWAWKSVADLCGHVAATTTTAAAGDVEIWDYKGTRAGNPFKDDYVRQLLTYAALYRDRTGALPVRCVLFFINEPRRDRRLLAIDVNEQIVDAALDWTYEQVRALRATADTFETDPSAVPAGELARDAKPIGQRLSQETTAQCTACTFRFDCAEYTMHLPRGAANPDVTLGNVFKN
ncbi:PD-(D/E)XK nuclease superfamily protein [Mycobacterium bohemicum DSM 44277]|nr:PD-(D/E)XK nuclease family protein [Mycobacterium bohemicum]MCV6970069.1 PD-(D/E)XK nuclease family protein [Mycobacterium bohemicum]CPR10449.1 PD-(D/E)XK nuclease superfamily protein [Mycobacterium bohemicum DSM 44277]